MNETLFIAVAIILSVSIVVVLLSRQAGKAKRLKKDEMLGVYKDIVSGNNLNISEEVILPTRVLAIDAAHKAFVSVYYHTVPVYDVVRLDNRVSCRVKKVGDNNSGKDKAAPVTGNNVKEVYLSFTMSGGTEINVPFYNEVYDGILDKMDLVAMAEEWQKKLTMLIKS